MAQMNDKRWRVMRPQRLRVRRWDDEVVVYDDRSGDTHILDDFAGYVLEGLMCSSASTDELLDAWLALDSRDHDESTLRRSNAVHLNDVIRRLRHQGIVKPVLK
ncbi:MAG: PqqD family protein of HPr-rel-A system [Gammaproteobacteria bacterium]|jgi:PqqD family protein of HPr-rel-A system